MTILKNKFILITLMLVIVIIIVLKINHSKINEDNLSTKKNQVKNVIFDLGANVGDSALFFADPTYICNNCHELKGICTKDNKKWILHSFEANPKYNEVLDNVTKIIQSYGHTHYLYKQSAAWIKNENLTFYVDTRQKGWGSSVHEKFAPFKTKIVAKGFDISEIIDQYSQEDYIVLKIDIEGTEFPLFEHLLQQGTINKVDYIAIEFHDIFKDQNSTYREKIKFYKTYLEVVHKPYSQWFLGHRRFLSDSVF